MRHKDPTRRLGGLGIRVLVGVLLVALVPLVGTSFASLWQTRSVIEGFLSESSSRSARLAAADLDAFLLRNQGMLRGVAARLGDDLGVAQLSSALQTNGELLGLFVVDAAGAVVGAANDEPEWAFAGCRQAARQGRAFATHAGAGHAHELVLAERLEGGGTLCGRVSFTVHERLLADRLDGLTGASSYILDADARVVCHAFEAEEPHVVRGQPHPDATAAALASSGPWAGTLQLSEGRHFVAFARSTILPWGVWVDVPASGAADALVPVLRNTALLALLFALLVAGAAWLVARRLVSPILAVAEAASHIASDRPGAQVPVTGDDEVADLARQFNQMSAALAASYATLEQTVDARTRALRTAREFSDQLLDSLEEPVLVFGVDQRLVRANRAARAQGGLPEAAGGRDAAAVLGDGCARHSDFRRSTTGNVQHLRRDTYPVSDDRGGVRAAIEITRDVTVLTQLQAQAAHQEKMAAVGVLAAGVAHELGNPLASLSSELELLEAVWDPAEARGALPRLRQQIDRMARLLREMSALGRSPQASNQVVDLRSVVEQTARLLRHDPRAKGVEIEVDAPAAVRACTNSDHLLQVLLNLGLNALDAVEGSGHIRLRLAGLPPEGAVLRVVDDGPGLSSSVGARAFDPFFTTKPAGQGTGLGLFVSDRLVRGLGGKLSFESPTDGGTTFTITLPDCGCSAQPEELT